MQYRQHEVIAVGLNRLHSDTLHTLFEWADLVILLDGRYESDLLREYVPRQKLLVWDCGPDTFDHHYNPDLVAMLRAFGKNTDPNVWKGGH